MYNCGTRIHDFFLRSINVDTRNFTCYILSVVDRSIDKMKGRGIFSLRTRQEFSLAGRENKRPDQLCNRDSLDAALMTPYTVCRRRVIGQRLVRDACPSSDKKNAETCCSMQIPARCHPARLLFPLTYKDATAITHLRYYATLLSQFFPTSWNVFFV